MPTAGVWVIAETTDLPTKYRKIVITGDGGKLVIPPLPKANFTIWSAVTACSTRTSSPPPSART